MLGLLPRWLEVARGAFTAVCRSLTFPFASQATAARGPFTPEDCYRACALSNASALEPTSLGAGGRILV